MNAISRRHRFESPQAKTPATTQTPAGTQTPNSSSGVATPTISDKVSLTTPEAAGDESGVSNRIDALNSWLGGDPYAAAKSGSAGSAINFGDAGKSKVDVAIDALGGGLLTGEGDPTVRTRGGDAPAPEPLGPFTPTQPQTPSEPQTPTLPTDPVEGPPLYDPGYFDNGGGN